MIDDILPTRLALGVYRSSHETQTGSLGEIVASFAEPNDVLVLTGDLGAGKTRFSQGFADGLGVKRRVTSPTFVIHVSYPGEKVALEHMDLYRVGSPEDLEDIDFAYILESGGVSLVEWGDRFPDELPDDVMTITFAREAIVADAAYDATSEPARIIRLDASGPRSSRLMMEVDHVMGGGQ